MNSRFGSGLGQFLGGMFGDSGAPYEDAMNQYRKWMGKGEGALNPYMQAGQRGMGNFEDWLGGMKGASGDYQKWLQGMQNPSGFINNLMGQYQESPWAKYQQQQAMRAANNMGAASGLTGSTPLQMQAQQNASNISSHDMGNWLQNVLGINSQYGAGQRGLMGMYGQGQQGLMGQGFNAANSLAEMYNQMGQRMGDAAYGQRAGENQDSWNTIGGILGMLGGIFG
jgi:hypothetical protein